MKKAVLLILVVSAFHSAVAQKAKDLFTANDVKVSWLGIDYSHCVLIGGFAQFKDAGIANAAEVKGKYFPAWNNLIINEQKKYDVKEMLHRDNIFFDVDMIMSLNAKAPAKNLESLNEPGYTQEDIAKFVKSYSTKGKDGIGVAFVVECLNKGAERAVVHFVAINMKTKDVLIYERINGKPSGFGIRNYWAGSNYSVIKQIRGSYYKTWKSKYGKG